MYLAESELISFRNYRRMQVSWSEKTNILMGQNAQGKTNLLESIYFLSLTKSHRTNRDKELIRFGDSFAVLRGKEISRTGSTLLEVILHDKGKKVKLNGIEQLRLSDFIGTINVVLFAPEDLELIKGGPQLRRRFLDMEIGQVSPSYLYYLSRYNKILLQRNQGLKEIFGRKIDLKVLTAFNEQLALYAPKIWLKRLSFLEKMSVWAGEIHQKITNGRENLEIGYHGSMDLEGEMDEEILGKRYFSLLEENVKLEIDRGYTLYGPHRDDLTFHIDGNEVQKFGSQGQQRTVALSMKLAEIELIREEIGEYPILLLDDVFSELDASRQAHLITGFWDRCQTFITTTGIEAIPKDLIQQSMLFHIEGGEVTREQ